MKTLLSAVALAVALPAVAHAQASPAPAPAPAPAPEKECCCKKMNRPMACCDKHGDQADQGEHSGHDVNQGQASHR